MKRVRTYLINYKTFNYQHFDIDQNIFLKNSQFLNETKLVIFYFLLKKMAEWFN